MKQHGWNFNLIVQWAVVGVLSAFLMSLFISACQWYGGHVLSPTKLMLDTLVMTLILSALAGVIGALQHFEFLAGGAYRTTPGGKQSKDRIVMVSYDLSEARKGLRKQVLVWTVALPLVLGFVMVGFWKYGDAPWWAALVVAGGFEFLGLGYAISCWGVCKWYAGCRWIVESEGVRFESPRRGSFKIRWDEISMIRQRPLTVRKGNDKFTLPFIPGLLGKVREGNRLIQKRLRHRFEFEIPDLGKLNPIKSYIVGVAIVVLGLAIVLGWMAFTLRYGYEEYFPVSFLLFIMAVVAYVMFEQMRWRWPVNKMKVRQGMGGPA